eukprot:16173-Rhodomonas_salina.1
MEEGERGRSVGMKCNGEGLDVELSLFTFSSCPGLIVGLFVAGITAMWALTQTMREGAGGIRLPPAAVSPLSSNA